MIASLSLVFLIGLAMASVCQQLRLPRLVGMLLTGVVLGPYVLDWLDPSLLGISSELRRIALIIILIKAGLSLNVADLRKVGRPALLLSFVPACCEIVAYAVFAPLLLGLGRTEAALMGSVMAAVSPAVVVPKMVRLIDERRGTAKGIPQMILAGSSLDDVFVIVLFTTFLGMAQGEGASVAALAGVPISIVLGIVLGASAGWLLHAFFEACHLRGRSVRNSVKVVVVLSVSFALVSVETLLSGYVPLSGLLAVMSMACVLHMRSAASVGRRLSEKFGKLWIAAEVMLFVLVGAAVDIRYTVSAGLGALAMIVLGLAVRSVGVLLCLLGTPLSRKERLFCVIAYLPKATVQAAIGSVPLSLGLPCSSLVLSVAVLGILLTAPLGALGMDATDRRLLTCAPPEASAD